ncbi:hypothetical protein I7I48_06548 [Histoplasma ohiense]|nr:hypothetical protein I7I48_06548 [Histoplasma ohiense (nom. inval.)]
MAKGHVALDNFHWMPTRSVTHPTIIRCNLTPSILTTKLPDIPYDNSYQRCHFSFLGLLSHLAEIHILVFLW